MANERRLIDANALLFTTLTDGGYWTVDVVYKRDILDAATVDAVEVVRCKDCKQYGIWADGRAMNYCWKHDRLAHDDEFCSYGEKREVE